MGEVHLFDVAQGKKVKVFKDSHTDVVNHVCFHPQTGQLFTAAEDNLVVVLDAEKPRGDKAMCWKPSGWLMKFSQKKPCPNGARRGEAEANALCA
ncbi:unnamed protein product [Effrenium voratum]|uniref:Uncharacterized protein n=1 Tax=Effrenium voratum TaxID=2562239 RepID=A0AA36J4Q9_9DINO|nr:unnamed protein product [Effrenium voratum]